MLDEGLADRQLQMKMLASRWIDAQPAVASFIASMVDDFNDAEDILQQVAMTTIDRLQDYDPSRPFVAWVMGIAKIEILRYRRRRSGDRHVFSESLLDVLAAAHLEVEAENNVMRGALLQCLKKLNARARSVLRLRYEHDYRLEAIGKQLDMTKSGAAMLLHRVRHVLRKCIRQEMLESER